MNIRQQEQAAGYRLEVAPLNGTTVARNGSAVIASSADARIMHETRLDPVVYFPRKDVTAILLRSTGHRTFCPFKGTATYWDVEVGGKVYENAAWTYMNALPEAADVEGFVAFMPDVLTAVDFADGSSGERVHGNISGPTIDWIMREAWLCETPEALTEAIAQKFNEDGIAVSRISVLIWSLHPLIAGRNYVWTRKGGVKTNTPSYDILDSPAFVNSPLRHVSNGLGGVRQNLLAEQAEFSFPIMDDLKAEGATDYVAMPLKFSNGQINVMTLTSDHPDGFTTANLGLVFECSAVISRLYEVFTLRDNASSLLQTYLGKRTGARVLGGEIRRGDGDQIDAAILFCDLRGSSRLAEEMDREDYLILLNRFFDATTRIVNQNGGEVLKFIGDAVLAIFPTGDDAAHACHQALVSALAIDAEINAQAADSGCVSGLAFGNVTYGNVGSEERLDFTVIGSAANVAARLSDLGKKLGHTVVTTAEVAAAEQDIMQSLGAFDLHNVSTPVEAFAPVDGVHASIEPRESTANPGSVDLA
jgi:adenylate cyclase